MTIKSAARRADAGEEGSRVREKKSGSRGDGIFNAIRGGLCFDGCARSTRITKPEADE